LWAGGGEADPLLALEVQVAYFARAKHWGYWQTVSYLRDIERQHGTSAALFELSLQRAMDRTEQRMQEEAARGKKGRR